MHDDTPGGDCGTDNDNDDDEEDDDENSQGITELGAIKPSLALSTLAVFVLVYFALWKGVKSTGKVRIIFVNII